MQESIEIFDEMAKKATQNLLPKELRGTYYREYDKLLDWMAENFAEHINDTVRLGYFGDLIETLSPNFLCSKYSMAKKTSMINKNINITNYHEFSKYLKQGSKGYQPKKFIFLSREYVLKFINEAPNETSLMNKVFVVNVPETKSDKKQIFTIVTDKTV